MRSRTERTVLTAIAVALLAAAAAAWWTADQWLPQAGPWMEQAWRKITRPGPETLPPGKQPAQAHAAKAGASEPLAALPRNASPVRYRNRCKVNGRPRGYLRAFGMSRVSFRELALEGKIPGVTKSSW